MDNDAITRLRQGGELDADVVRRLAEADPAEMRAALAAFLPDDEVEAVLERVAALVRAARSNAADPR